MDESLWPTRGPNRAQRRAWARKHHRPTPRAANAPFEGNAHDLDTGRRALDEHLTDWAKRAIAALDGEEPADAD